MFKSKKMRAAEARLEGPLERTLAPLVTERGQAGTAAYLGVSKATVANWMLNCGIEVRRVALRPGESLEVVCGDSGAVRIIRNDAESQYE